MPIRYIFIIAAILAISFLMIMSLTIDDVSDEIEIEWNQDSVAIEGATVLLTDDIPGEVYVDEGISFGASGPFTSVILSPNNQKLVLTTSGAAHGAGWLYDLNTKDISPVEFQYGGSLEALSWSSDSQFIVFKVSTPADTNLISVVDINNIAEFVSNTSHRVVVEEENNLDPPFNYEFLGWESDEVFCFSFIQEFSYCFDVIELELIS